MRLNPMATLAAPLLQRNKEPDEEQLLKLFWNRAELKKELAALRREREKFIDQLRQQEAASLRTQQKLEQIETLLGDPGHAANVAVYYQLRSVWRHNRRQLQRLANELSGRQQEREEQHARRLFEQRRDAEVAELDARRAALAQRARAVQDEQKTIAGRIGRMRGFWNYFRRRALAEESGAVSLRRGAIEAEVMQLEAERREKERQGPPPFAGLSVEGRRHINLAVIAMAQQLLVHFSERSVAVLAREASARGVADANYGDIIECRALGQAIDSVLRSLGPREQLLAVVRCRAEALRGAVSYRTETDTVPVAGALASVPLDSGEAGKNRVVRKGGIPVNVLADDYWDVNAVLMD